MKTTDAPNKKFLVTWNTGHTTIIEGITEDDAHARARFNVYSWEEMRSCVEIQEGDQVEETLPLTTLNGKYLDRQFFPDC